MLNLVLSVVAGPIGVLVATIVSYLLFVIPQTWEVRRIPSGRYLKVKAKQKGLIEEVPMYGI